MPTDKHIASVTMETITENHKTEITDCRKPSPEGHIYVTAPLWFKDHFRIRGRNIFKESDTRKPSVKVSHRNGCINKA